MGPTYALEAQASRDGYIRHWSNVSLPLIRHFIGGLTIHSPCVSLVARLSFFTSAAVFDSSPSWWIVKTEDWVLAEYSSGLICASLIHLKPLVQRLLPSLLGDSREHFKDVQTGLPRYRNRTYLQLSRPLGRRSGYVSRSWVAAGLNSKGSGGTTETDGIVKVISQLELEEDCETSQPRSPDRVLTRPPTEGDRPPSETILLRHTSPV